MDNKENTGNMYNTDIKMQFRRGTIEDLDEIESLVKKAIELMKQQGIYQWDEVYPTREVFSEDIEYDSLYVATVNNKIIAVYVLNQDCDDEYYECKWDNPDDSACIIHRLCVSADFQNKGIGTKLLAHIEEQIKAMGYKSVRLDVFSENPYALKLYSKRGYEKRGQADWRKGRFFLMEKTL
jgi:ribosomal protein S18 acetylase RimI-like enzyme